MVFEVISSDGFSAILKIANNVRVTVSGATSGLLPVTSGAPQGTILGPALFLLYVNDLPNDVKSSRVEMFT